MKEEHERSQRGGNGNKGRQEYAYGGMRGGARGSVRSQRRTFGPASRCSPPDMNMAERETSMRSRELAMMSREKKFHTMEQAQYVANHKMGYSPAEREAWTGGDER